MTYYKYRQGFAWGYSNWEYIAISAYVSDIGEYLADRGLLSNWSDKWRSVEWKKVDILPREKIESEIESSRDVIKERKDRIKMLKGMLKAYPKIKAKVVLTEWEKITPGKMVRWSTISKGKRQLYISKKGFYSSKCKMLAKEWCDKNGYKIVETKYEKTT